jgi:predicted GH43/DUF377 family glycosyl hydrolase
MSVDVIETHDINFSPDFKANPEIIAAMSMAVIKTEDYYQTLYRQVQKKDNQPIPESVLAFASSQNGVDFIRSGVISLQPSKEKNSDDILAVEDPTIIELDGKKYVFCTAVKPKEGAEGVIAAIEVVSGIDLKNIEDKKRIIIRPDEVGKELGRKVDMVKEPEFIRLKDNTWVVLYEFADGQTSRIGMARSVNLTGPYRNHQLLMDTRSEGWDCQHISPGPIMITSRGDLLMLYNGRGPKNMNNQTPMWAIGSVIVDTNKGSIIEGTRSEKPIIVPPEEIGPNNQLIAFSNSIVASEQRLYYTVADKRSRVAKLDFNNI